MTYTTLNKIRANSPCKEGWAKLLKYLNKTEADDELLALTTILDSNGLDDALWCLCAVDDKSKVKLFAIACVKEVQHLITNKYTIAVLEQYAREDTEELRAAWTRTWGNAWDTARAAAWTAARGFVQCAAKDATIAAARKRQAEIFRNFFGDSK